MMPPSHDVAMSTDPSPVAAFPTRIVVQALASVAAQHGKPHRTKNAIRWLRSLNMATSSPLEVIFLPEQPADGSAAAIRLLCWLWAAASTRGVGGVRLLETRGAFQSVTGETT